ncbi:MAG TPA: class C sortase, partial [Lachnospiraceae bacterium]|nr:class C sortase [Lachnospiraceae bacterium]
QEERQKLWDAAAAYNEKLSKEGLNLMLSDQELEEYNSVLDVTGTGIMGYVDIPKINVSLPIYHGTDESVLQIAIGHIAGSSLPVGGAGSHCVISGHRGLPSARLFTDIDQLQEGDRFMLQVLGETLTYEVDQIRTVLPDELDDLQRQNGQDYCTLVTCTPYGVNTHRLLVRGHRVPNTEGDVRVNADAIQINPMEEALIIGAVLMFLILLWSLISTRNRGRHRHIVKP